MRAVGGTHNMRTESELQREGAGALGRHPGAQVRAHRYSAPWTLRHGHNWERGVSANWLHALELASQRVFNRVSGPTGIVHGNEKNRTTATS
jgi:hypothetical protein